MYSGGGHEIVHIPDQKSDRVILMLRHLRCVTYVLWMLFHFKFLAKNDIMHSSGKFCSILPIVDQNNENHQRMDFGNICIERILIP